MINLKECLCLSVFVGGLCCLAAAEEISPVHFHHVHLNVVDPAKTIQFYKDFFGAIEVNYRGVAPAIFTERSFILMNKVDAPAATHLITSLWHIGWGGKDGPAEYEWFKSRGAEFNRELTALGSRHFFYVYGPDREVMEVWTGYQNHRFGHVHLFAADVNETVQWFERALGARRARELRPKPEANQQTRAGIWSNAVNVDNVNIIIYRQPNEENIPWFPEGPLMEFESTAGKAIDHIAFSYEDIEPVYERMKNSGIHIVKEISEDPTHKFRGFFIENPDKLLIEIVEERPIPEGIWNE